MTSDHHKRYAQFFALTITMLLQLFSVLVISIASVLLSLPIAAAIKPAPERAEGDGPYPQLILRGVTLINGTGAPAFGPVDIVIEGNTIVQAKIVGSANSPIDPDDRPKLKAGGREIDLSGHFVMPGIVDMHGHIGGDEQGVDAEYVYKLWLAHGITTVRDPGCGNGIDWCVSEMRRSQNNTITAPRIYPYVFFAQGSDAPFTRPQQARDWVRAMQRKGALGVKCFGYRPDILEAAFAEMKKLGMRSACHHAQLNVADVNVLTTARWGLTTMEHWYGLPEALFDGQTVQQYPADYNYMNEQHRFFEAGKLWTQAAKPGSKRWNAVRDELIELDFTIDPTFTIYQATRDVMRARNADWHTQYTHPALMKFFTPNRDNHGSFFFDWGSEQEVAWKKNYQQWMTFINDFKNHGGRVTVGSDAGYIYKLYGFATIEELELLREAGFHPLEVIRAATLNGAQALGATDKIGSIEAGKLADLVVLDENPLANLKVLYGTGHTRLNKDGDPQTVGGVRYTIKDGIIFDAKKLLDDIRNIVDKAKTKHSMPAVAKPQ